jgi:DNA repair photolyase
MFYTSNMGWAQYVEKPCKTFLNRVSGMPFKWSANPYRGCVHDCQYCFARVTHSFLNLDGEQFSRVIQVKTNAPAVLRTELARKTWRRERVALGTATDPYQPIEGTYKLTRRCLEAFAEGRTPVTIVTKGTLVRRDIDVLQSLAAVARVTVCFSIPTIDVDLWRRLEPGTPPPLQRLKAVRTLADAGIHAGVLLAPIIPALTTRDGGLESVIRAAKEHGARFVGGSVLHLRPGVRDHFFGYLRREHPGLLPVYRKLYPGAYVSESFKDRVAEVVDCLKARFGFVDEPEQHTLREQSTEPDAQQPVQLSLFAPLRTAG